MRKVSMMLMLAGLMMATSCGNLTQKKNQEEPANEEQQPVSQIEQVQQPVVQRTAFLPAANTPDFVNAAEHSVDAVVHIMTKIVRQSNTYDDFFGALFGQLYGYPGQSRSNTQVAYGSGVVLTPDGYIVTNISVLPGVRRPISVLSRTVYTLVATDGMK